jgi:3-oxoadipate enol-lactonase
VDKAVIMGTSMGGTITQRFIIDFPEKTLAAVIMSTSSRVNEKAKEVWEKQADFIEQHGMAAWVRQSRAPHMTEEWLREHPEVLEAEERRIQNNQNGKVYAQAARAVAFYNFDEGLQKVKVPALVMVGSEDKQTPPGGSVIISRLIEGSRLHILEGLGHTTVREAPEKVLSLVLPFLAEVTQGSGVAAD